MTDSAPPLVIDQAADLRVIQVAAETKSAQLAGSIAEEVRQAMARGKRGLPNITLHAIGPQSVSTGVKAVCIANGYISTHGLVLVILPTFEDKTLTPRAGSPPDATPEVRTVTRMRLVPWRLGG